MFDLVYIVGGDFQSNLHPGPFRRDIKEFSC